MSYQIDVKTIGKVWGDRVLIRRLGAPKKKRGLYVPETYANKKEAKKIWFGYIVAFGSDSHAHEDHELTYNDLVGIEPIGHHYASFQGEDGDTYCWVPDEHLCLADLGSLRDYFAGELDTQSVPRVRVLGSRCLVRNVAPEELSPEKRIITIPSGERETKVAEVIGMGKFRDEDIPGISIGDRVIHVSEDNGSSSVLDIFDPEPIVLRQEDLIARLDKRVEAHA